MYSEQALAFLVVDDDLERDFLNIDTKKMTDAHIGLNTFITAIAYIEIFGSFS